MTFMWILKFYNKLLILIASVNYYTKKRKSNDFLLNIMIYKCMLFDKFMLY